MAKIPYGLMGPVIGKVGSIVGCNGKNGPYIRALPKKRKDRPTPLQKLQRARFVAASRFVTPMRALLNISFYKESSKKPAVALACSYILKNAVYASGTRQKIRFSSVLVSQGYLPPAVTASAVVSAPHSITFTWTSITGLGKSSDRDRAIMVVYCEYLKKCAYIIDGASRNAGTDIIQIPGFSGKTVQTWLGFISDNGREIAPSVYTGELKL